MKILVIIAAIAVFQTVSVFADGEGEGEGEGEGCNFDPIDACNRCEYSRSYVQYVPNHCNCNEYYSCEKTRGHITAHKQVCPPCLCFSKETWGCTIHNGEECPTEPPITEILVHHGDCCYRYGNGPQGDYLQKYSAVYDEEHDGWFNWIVNDFPIKMRCPAGTYFNLTLCQCLHCVPGKRCPVDDYNVFCLDWENRNAERGIWYNADASCSVYTDNARLWPSSAPLPYPSPNHELHLPGAPCNVEIPFFQNNEFSEFTLCGWFRPSHLGREQGLAFDGGAPGDDCYPGTIYINLNSNDHVYGGIRTTASPVPYSTIVTTLTVQPSHEYKVCLRYDGSRLYLGVQEYGGSLEESWVSASGVTLRNKCNMMLGSSFDNGGVENFFEGELDDWCFYRKAITPYPAPFP